MSLFMWHQESVEETMELSLSAKTTQRVAKAKSKQLETVST